VHHEAIDPDGARQCVVHGSQHTPARLGTAAAGDPNRCRAASPFSLRPNEARRSPSRAAIAEDISPCGCHLGGVP
jgi:hypothetical protein